MKKLFILLLTFSPFVVPANNVHITKDVSVDAKAIKDNIATIQMTIAWENSWRDDFNQDAVYVFVKYRLKGTMAWKHAYLLDAVWGSNDSHKVSTGFEYNMAKSNATQNQCMGIFVQRSAKGSYGEQSVSLQLKWNINGHLTQQNFLDEKVEYHATCIEMVYVPQGAYCIGDGISSKTFQTNYRPILPEWDLIKNDGTMTFYSGGGYVGDYTPEKAANRINEYKSTVENAWYAATADASWEVDFKTKKKVLYFGVSGAMGHHYHRPLTWSLEGKNESDDWRELWKGNTVNISRNEEDWVITNDSYPVPRAIKVTTPGEYRYYRIKIISPHGGYLPIANNIAMTEVDISKMTHDAYIMDRSINIQLDTFINLCAKDGLAWTGMMNSMAADGPTLQTYPTGFNGFYAMKYEVTQEQWVRFLNKLEYKQQKQRTIGNKLDELIVGDYVYGTDKNVPNDRNGIAIGARLVENIVFVNDLNGNNDFSQEDDGKTVACNYLSADDMLAYADWCGLRPLSEMEYEKMARDPYPHLPRQREWAGGEAGVATPAELNNLHENGRNDEEIDGGGNVNAEGKISGPLRAGIFAGVSGLRAEAGSGFWGVMELSGNLSEIYYRCSPEGRQFTDMLISHGDGYVVANTDAANTGNTDMSPSYWPVTAGAFILRGGSFASQKAQIAISDRSDTYLSEMNTTKNAKLTFRLGHSFGKLKNETQPVTQLKLANGQVSTPTVVGIDTVCSGSSYTLRGTPISAIDKPKARYSYIWYISENEGTTWRVIRGEEGQDLTYNNFQNDKSEARLIRFKRKTIGMDWWSETNYATIYVVNVGYTFNRLSDTITRANHVLGYWVDTKVPARFAWKWKSPTGTQLLHDGNSNTLWDFYAPLRREFPANTTGEQKLVCEMVMMNRCIKREELDIYIQPRPTEGVDGALISINAIDPKFKCGTAVIDDRRIATDRQLYTTVQIGDQCWMAENLRFDLRNGNSRKIDNDVVGSLYYISGVAETVCPGGWRLPIMSQDLDILLRYLNTDGANRAGAKLKQGALWAPHPSYKAHLGTNESGFGAAASGYFYGNGAHTAATTNFYMGMKDFVYFYWLDYSNSIMNGYSYYWSYGYYFPIRCIKS